MTHHRFEANRWYNAIGTAEPAFRCRSGDVVITETLDAWGLDRHGQALASRPNPMNGPIHVEGAEPGDALRVEILRITPTRSMGWTFSPLAPNVVDPAVVRSLPPSARYTWSIDPGAGTVRLDDPPPELADLVLDLDPMIGCFGVAPALGQAISTATSAENGGNMDYRGFKTGTVVWLPVAVSGALFYLGDCHAVQGDGEIVGTGIETTCEVEVRLTVEKGRRIGWPRGETGTEIFTAGNARPLDQALQHATSEMLAWLTGEYGYSVLAASHLLGQVVRYEVGNVFDPAYTMICKVDKRWLRR